MDLVLISWTISAFLPTFTHCFRQPFLITPQPGHWNSAETGRIVNLWIRKSTVWVGDSERWDPHVIAECSVHALWYQSCAEGRAWALWPQVVTLHPFGEMGDPDDPASKLAFFSIWWAWVKEQGWWLETAQPRQQKHHPICPKGFSITVSLQSYPEICLKTATNSSNKGFILLQAHAFQGFNSIRQAMVHWCTNMTQHSSSETESLAIFCRYWPNWEE